MSQVKTSREDLANLGWPIQQVYNAANQQRGGTMEGLGDLSLNDGIAAEYQWWCYNATIGEPTRVGNSVDSVNETETVWSYDNSANLQPFTTTWTESWKSESSATLSITNRASLTLGQSITIPGVGGSEFSISISTEATSGETRLQTHELTNSWELTVGPGEKLSVERTQTTTTGRSQYNLAYGVNDAGLLGTKGRTWNGHYYWGMNVNWLLNYPRGIMTLEGYSRKNSYAHKIVRTPAPGREAGPLVPAVLAKPVQVTLLEDGTSTKLEYVVPGPK